MKLRHEYKHYINYSDYLILKQRLKVIMSPDKYTNEKGQYQIRSLYFDNIYDKALREKIDGINCREKFRIRIYNNDPSLIRLEKKSKIDHLCNKKSTIISKQQTLDIIDGKVTWILNSNDDLLLEFYSKMKSQLLKPKTIVEYTREPYVMRAGNVRVTIDSNIKTSILNTDFLNMQAPLITAGEKDIILEVKYDNFLPEIVHNVVNIGNLRTTAFSKHAVSRIYG
ncbi:MAG: polyphosphate polymerase domain-containing protein [Eubacteriaceae bacterium]